MATSLKTLLQHAGLRKPEADVYLASLHLGEATVQDIAHTVGLPRTTTASILDRLCQEGFMSVHVSRGRRVYWIEDPHILVEKEKARLSVFEQLSGRLHAEYHQADKRPVVELYDTREAIETLMAKVIGESSKGSEMLVFEAPLARHYQSVISDELFHAMSAQKVAKGIQTKALIPYGQAQEIRPQALKHGIQIRVLPEGLAFEISFWILDDAIVLFLGTHQFAVRLRHRHTAESFRSLFWFLWKTASAPSVVGNR